VALRERPYPKIVPGYALVEVAIAPICIEHQVYKEHRFEWHSDEEHQGHEGVGTVVEVAAGSRFEVGDRVIMYQGNPCQDCFVCRRQLSPTHCLSIPYEELRDTQDPHTALEALGGGAAIEAPGGLMSIQKACNSPSGAFGFEQYRISNEFMMQRIPDDLSFRYAALANCSLGCTYTALEEVDINTGDWVVVAGVGFIGFGSIINAKYRGANVIVLGRNPFRMELAKRMGADYIINPDDEDWLDQVHELTGDLKGADLVIEASGYPYYQERALRAVRRFGTMWMYGFLVDSYEPYPMQLLEDIHNRGVKLTGTHDVFLSHREGLVKMLGHPQVQEAADLLISHEYNMSQGAEAFEAALSKKAGKVYLYPQEDCPNPGPSETAARLAEQYGP
jgi:threonine dehydrogenase-like Zn-dependent dehydrogenase